MVSKDQFKVQTFILEIQKTSHLKECQHNSFKNLREFKIKMLK